MLGKNDVEFDFKIKKGKVFYGLQVENLLPQKAGVNYQLLAVITEVAQCGTPSYSRPQSATDNGVRDSSSNLLVVPPPSWAVTMAPRALYKSMQLSHSRDSIL